MAQVINKRTQLKEVFRDPETAIEIIANSPYFDQDSAKSLLEVMITRQYVKNNNIMSKQTGVAQNGHYDWGLGLHGCRFHSSLISLL